MGVTHTDGHSRKHPGSGGLVTAFAVVDRVGVVRGIR